jgi:hypothetical protein
VAESLGFGVSEIRVMVLSLLPPNCVAIGNSLNFLNLSFLICKNGFKDSFDRTGGVA